MPRRSLRVQKLSAAQSNRIPKTDESATSDTHAGDIGQIQEHLSRVSLTETGTAAGPEELEERLMPLAQVSLTDTRPPARMEPDDQFAHGGIRYEHVVTESPQKVELRLQIARLTEQLQERDAENQKLTEQLQALREWVAEQAALAVGRGEELSRRLESQILAGNRALAELEAMRKDPYTLLLSALRRVDDLSSFVSSTTRSAQRVDVRKVLLMPGFKEKQVAYLRSIKSDLEKRERVMTIPDEVFSDAERTAISEGDLEKLLYMHVFTVLNKLFDDVQTGSVSRAGCGDIKADGASFLKLTRKLILLLELKRHNLTTHGTDLARVCEALLGGPTSYPQDCLDAVQQIAGYLTRAGVRFGILTTYEFWWLVELCSDGTVMISPPYYSLEEGECSVLAMLHYAITLAKEPVGSRDVTLPLVSRPRRKDGGGGRDASESGDKENHDSNAGRGGGGPGGRGGKKEQPSGKRAAGGGRQAAGGAGRGGAGRLEFVRHLVEHGDRITFQARLGEQGRLVAVKAYDTAEARDREAARFRELRRLRAVPALVDARLELEWTDAEERRVHALVLAWVGPPDADGQQCALPREGLEQVRQTLEAMHRLGVAHGDVRGPNLAWDPEAKRAFVLADPLCDLSESAVMLVDGRGLSGWALAVLGLGTIADLVAASKGLNAHGTDGIITGVSVRMTQ